MDYLGIDARPDDAITPQAEGDRDGMTGRLVSVDLLRGAVMILMALDHVRDYLMDVRVSPTNLEVATPALFFTRWITHFCAPTFIFLAGSSAFLAGTRGKTQGQLSLFLLKRGLWLILLEQTWVSFSLTFTMPKVILALILWAIGWSMIALAGLIFLPRALVGAIGIGLIAFHNLFDGLRVESSGVGSLLWRLLHEPGFVPLVGGIGILEGYPLIPWIGVMAVGYAFGPVLLLPPDRRRTILVALGVGLTLGFVGLRALNVYGDPRPWTVQATPLLTLMSFLNCQKYPPSLLYLLMALGPAILALAWLDRLPRFLAGPLATFGQVPLFFFLLHLPVAHGLGVAVAALRGQPVGWLFETAPFQSPEGYDNSLATVYLCWVVAIVILYLPCRWFADVKRRRRDSWLSYL
ncbi:heparan-alpha-glucosaminide N-acetyltransferase domain-containing protein [Singulisphaera sp. Ch08]|uniref:Heparan-alpha-glucosaminide N-acetyltransferase domain-containing protein n=1 Tax=Singulisphaera sp. Ch08 TaxID=3120278 RepID=A0AAU7CHZ1_9BACT